MFEETHFDHWPAFVDHLRSRPPGSIFRGQRDAAWRLTTSLERITNPENREDRERFFGSRFKSSMGRLGAPSPAPGFPGRPPYPDSETWALMQHHGAPTRLLDWTSSPFVACFFALVDSADGAESAVYVLDRPKVELAAAALLHAQVEQVTTVGPEFEMRDTKIDEAMKEGLVKAVFVLDPLTASERLWAQQGRFLAPVCLSCTFEENLAATLDACGVRCESEKLILSPKLRADALSDLWRMNISHAPLFPGIDGFARSFPQMEIALRPRT